MVRSTVLSIGNDSDLEVDFLKKVDFKIYLRCRINFIQKTASQNWWGDEYSNWKIKVPCSTIIYSHYIPQKLCFNRLVASAVIRRKQGRTTVQNMNCRDKTHMIQCYLPVFIEISFHERKKVRWKYSFLVNDSHVKEEFCRKMKRSKMFLTCKKIKRRNGMQ